MKIHSAGIELDRQRYLWIKGQEGSLKLKSDSAQSTMAGSLFAAYM
jgi:hypothetical protein